MPKRCSWANHSELMKRYHDEEWGVPVHHDKLLFEQLVLQSAQAGLSWITILKKRENYRRVFDNFDFERIATYDERKIQELLNNKGIVRNELKIRSTVNNAKIFQQVREKYGSFNDYIWNFVDNTPIQNHWNGLEEIPGETELSKTISKQMKKLGFSFIGLTIMYAYMQAVGMVNDHLTYCYRYSELKDTG
jgi:DNA-3-methyladenine glycosylase I